MFEITVIALTLPGLLFLVGIVTSLFFNHREIRKVHQDGICDRCGYDLTGNASGVCPECGLRVPKNAGDGIPG